MNLPSTSHDGDSSSDPSETSHTSRPSAARAQAEAVGRSAAEADRDVAYTATEQAGRVTEETRRQVEGLLTQAREQVTDQVRGGQHKAGETLRSIASELRQMADGSETAGPASELAKEAAHRVGGIAGWLERHEPGDVLDEVRGLARRRPAAFLAGATLAGVVVGRLTRGRVDAGRADSPDRGESPRRAAGLGGTDSERLGRGRIRRDPANAAPGHAPRPGATTVGEYVEQLERRGELDHPPVAGTV